MTLEAEDICTKLRYLDTQYTGNAVDEIVTYSVQSRNITLFIEKTMNQSYRYKVVFNDYNTGDRSETDILFTAYPRNQIDHSIIIGNNHNRVYKDNSGMQKNFREILKALGKLYNVPVCRQHT